MAKSALMLIGSCQKLKDHNVSILISRVISTKYLGVNIDQHLTWQCHIEYIVKKIRTKLFGLHCLKPLPNSLLATLYCGYILPIFDYCNTVWSPPTAVLSKSLERSLHLPSVVDFILLCKSLKVYISLKSCVSS